MKLIAHIDIEQLNDGYPESQTTLQPGSFRTMHAPITNAIHDALQDLAVTHPHGMAVVESVSVTIEEAPA